MLLITQIKKERPMIFVIAAFKAIQIDCLITDNITLVPSLNAGYLLLFSNKIKLFNLGIITVFSPYCVMKAIQLSTMMGISFLLSCWSFSVLAFPPAAFWMSVYHREKSIRPIPCKCRVLSSQTHRIYINMQA